MCPCDFATKFLFSILGLRENWFIDQKKTAGEEVAGKAVRSRNIRTITADGGRKKEGIKEGHRLAVNPLFGGKSGIDGRVQSLLNGPCRARG